MHRNFELFECSGFSENSGRADRKYRLAVTEIKSNERIEIVKLHED
jgi:hypothetical protein